MKETVVAKDKDHLKTLISKEIKKHGYQCNLNHIDVHEVSDMSWLFYSATQSPAIVDDMGNLIYPDKAFNGDISQWDTSNVTDMSSMFYQSLFTGDISKWNISKVKNMRSMFEGSIFNSDISQWNTSNLENMSFMFSRSLFDKDISKWDVSKVQMMVEIFKESKFSKDLTLWKPMSLKKGKGNRMFENSKAATPYWSHYADNESLRQAIEKYNNFKQLEEIIKDNKNDRRKIKI